MSPQVGKIKARPCDNTRHVKRTRQGQSTEIEEGSWAQKRQPLEYLPWIFSSDDHYIYYCGQESLRNGVTIIVNKRVQNAVLGCNLKNNRMISVHFQGKPFNIMVIQVYTPTSNAEEAEAAQFYEDLQDL